MRSVHAITILAVVAGVASCNRDDEDDVREYFAEVEQGLVLGNNKHAHSLHLEENLRFPSIRPGSNADTGRELFGLASDLETMDTTFALFEGQSQAYGPLGYPVGAVVASNGRACATCHRGQSLSFGMPQPPLTDTIDLNDPLFTGIEADAQGDPDAFDNLNERALFKYRPNRFNLARSPDDPFRKVFFWRKSPTLVNVVFQRGFLNDGRARTLFEAARGAVFSHTQETDFRFDDLLTVQAGRDWEAFLFSRLSDPALEGLLDEDHPLHGTLAQLPFVTVPVTNYQQFRGKWVFIRDCMGCHNTPNVFNNISNVQGGGLDPDRTPLAPTHAPNVGRGFNIGVSERNAHGLRFTAADGEGGFESITLELADEDGTPRSHTVTFDIGMAATTARTADIGRFKVPQLRNISSLGPYFHDNSADTLEDVITYFNSAHYNNSLDGKRFPIHQSAEERADLLAFLNVL